MTMKKVLDCLLVFSMFMLFSCSREKQTEKDKLLPQTKALAIDHQIDCGDSVVTVYKKDVLHPIYEKIGKDSIKMTVINGNNQIVKIKKYHIKELP